MFAWCATGTIIGQAHINDTSLWLKIPDGNDSMPNCVALTKIDANAKLSLASCAEPKPYICEVLEKTIYEF